MQLLSPLFQPVPAALRLASPRGRALFTPRHYRRQPPVFAEHLAGPLTITRPAHG